MLRELAAVSQPPGTRVRRWFQAPDDELIVWYESGGAIYGFQLCYDRQRRERALTWTPERGFAHNRIDSGEREGLGYKRTPVLVADGAFDARAMRERFLGISAALPGDIREFVASKLAEYPGGAPAK